MIPIKNIYYMLSYAFQSLKNLDVKDVDVESFDNAQKLCAEILIKGIQSQIKRGLNREYISKTETISSLKGKIDISDSIKTQALLRRQTVCTFDEFAINNSKNQIIKTTLSFLIKSDIYNKQKKEIRRINYIFDSVDEIDIHRINWNQQYNRNNNTYQLLIIICYFVIKGLLQTQKNGTTRIMDFFDEQRMSRLYEKFILEYYKKHFPELSPSASYIDWQLDDENDSMLPIMKSDIMLQKEDNVLIIDAKYYSHNTQIRFEKNTVHSNNLYQLFTYVKNKEYELRDRKHKVSGMLLYAKTDEEIQPKSQYSMSGNIITVNVLDLNEEFINISEFLNHIADTFFKY